MLKPNEIKLDRVLYGKSQEDVQDVQDAEQASDVMIDVDQISASDFEELLV